MPFAEGTPTAMIALGGELYELGFTLGAMRRAKEIGVLTNDAEDETAFMLALPAYVWVCLPEESRQKLSVDAIAELMNPTNIKDIAVTVGGLFKVSLPDEKPDPNVQAGPVTEPSPAPWTSKSFGQSESTISDSRMKPSGESLSVSL